MQTNADRPGGRPVVDPDAVYSAAEVAAILDISESLVRSAVPGRRIGPRVWRVTGETLLAFLNETNAGPARPAKRRADTAKPDPAGAAGRPPGRKAQTGTGPLTLDGLARKLQDKQDREALSRAAESEGGGDATE